MSPLKKGTWWVEDLGKRAEVESRTAEVIFIDRPTILPIPENHDAYKQLEAIGRARYVFGRRQDGRPSLLKAPDGETVTMFYGDS